MPTTVKIRRSGTASATPSALEHGEIAINYADGKVFWKNASDVITSFTFQSYALASHTHSISDVTGLQTALDGKAASSHTHSISDVTGLQTALDGKASSSHAHAASDITSGTLDAARLPLATTLAAGAVIVGTGLGVSSGTVSVTYGTSNTSACRGDDSRLSDTRTPTDGSVTTAKIANDAVTYAKIQNVSATSRILGRSSAGAGDVEELDAATARTVMSVQPTASPTFTGTAIVSGVFQVKANSGSLSHAFGYNENGGEISLYTTSEVQASLIDHVGGTGTRVLELVNGNDLYLGLGSGNTTGNVKIQRAGYVTAVTVSSTGAATFAGQVLVTAGSKTTCSVAPTGDPDTGMFFPLANTLALSTGDVERVRVDASGRVGIGTNLPGQSLHVLGGEFWLTNSNFSLAGGTGSIVTMYTGATTGNTYGGIGALTTGGGVWGDLVLQGGGGKVGIGTTAPAALLDLGSATGVKVFTYKSSGANAGIGTDLSGAAYECSIFAGGTADTHGRISFGRRRVDTGTYTERMVIDASGNVGIGGSPNRPLLIVNNGSCSMALSDTSTGGNVLSFNPPQNSSGFAQISAEGANALRFVTNAGERMRIASDGVVTMSDVYEDTVGATNRDLFIDSTGKLGYVSSIRESKTDIAAIDDVSWLSALAPVSYRYRKKNADGTYSDEADGVTDYGLIAEDVEAVKPELCFYDDVDGEAQLRGITYSKLITPMLKYIQQLEARIAALEEQLNG
jgi:hypothetical protein